MKVHFIIANNVKILAVNVKIKHLFVQAATLQMLIHYVNHLNLLIILIDPEKGLCCYVSNCVECTKEH